jgi:hypothetical protein
VQEISYLPGGGTVIAAGDTLLLLDAPGDAEVSRTLWRLVVAGMSHDQVRAVLQSYSPARLPDLGVASLTSDGLALLLRGAVRATVTTDSSTSDYTDQDRRVWTEYALGSVSRVRLWLREPDPSVHALPLVGGVVWADAVFAALAGAASPRRVVAAPLADPGPAAPPSAPPAHAPVAAPPAPMDGVFVERAPATAAQAPAPAPSLAEVWVNQPPPALDAPVQSPPPGSWPPPPRGSWSQSPPAPPPGSWPPHEPLGQPAAIPAEPPGSGQRAGVWASRCPYGHLNAPDAPNCRICGEPIVERDLSFVARPPLGRLDFGPLGSVPLDGDLLIGRDPGAQPADAPRPVVVAHPGLSPRHLEVQVRGWTVMVVDLDSENGSTVVLPGRVAKPLRARSPEPIVDGTVVWLGQQVHLTYVAA